MSSNAQPSTGTNLFDMGATPAQPVQA